MRIHGNLLDRATQRWVEVNGRRVDLSIERWLDGPVGRTTAIDTSWLSDEVTRLGGQLSTASDQGLLPSMAVLDRPGFRVADLHPDVVDFYEHTRRWRIDVWSQWSPLFVPGAWLLMALFARRLQQFSLPLRPIDVSRGMVSEVTQVASPSGEHLGAAWQRTARLTGENIYGGWYSTAVMPGRDWASVRVAFPLPNGNLQVFLRPETVGSDSLRLTSGLGRFGEEGTYLVVASGPETRAVARRVPIAESFTVYVDEDGVLRADHQLRMWNAKALQLHYRLTRELDVSAGSSTPCHRSTRVP